MFVDILRILFFAAIAIPFLYMVFDVTLEIFRGVFHFYRSKTKPVLVRVASRNNRFS